MVNTVSQSSNYNIEITNNSVLVKNISFIVSSVHTAMFVANSVICIVQPSTSLCSFYDKTMLDYSLIWRASDGSDEAVTVTPVGAMTKDSRIYLLLNSSFLIMENAIFNYTIQIFGNITILEDNTLCKWNDHNDLSIHKWPPNNLRT